MGGWCEQSTAQEIALAKAEIGAEGIGCEPASAVTLAGLKKLVAQGRVKPGERVVLILTGPRPSKTRNTPSTTTAANSSPPPSSPPPPSPSAPATRIAPQAPHRPRSRTSRLSCAHSKSEWPPQTPPKSCPPPESPYDPGRRARQSSQGPERAFPDKLAWPHPAHASRHLRQPRPRLRFGRSCPRSQPHHRRGSSHHLGRPTTVNHSQATGRDAQTASPATGQQPRL